MRIRSRIWLIWLGVVGVGVVSGCASSDAGPSSEVSLPPVTRSVAVAPAGMSDEIAACVTRQKTFGKSFLQAAASCEVPQVGLVSVPMLDFSGSPALLREAVLSGYCNGVAFRPASDRVRRTCAVATRQVMAEAERGRQSRQGATVRQLDAESCSRILQEVPQQARSLVPASGPAASLRDSPYLTSQENYCLALTRSYVLRYPGMQPGTAEATYLGSSRVP